MKKILWLLAAVALALNTPARAQSPLPFAPLPVTLTLTQVTDAAVLPIFGAYWATARVTFNTNNSELFEVSYTIDGVNWLAAGAQPGCPYLKRVDAVATSPTVVLANSTSPLNPSSYTAGSVWELALASNVQGVRVRPTTATGSNSVTVSAGIPYTYGSPVTAVLYDQTEGSIGAGLLSSAIFNDVSGWSVVTAALISPTGANAAVRPVDDSGGAIAGILQAGASAGSNLITFTRQGASANNASVAAGNWYSYPLAAKRMSWYIPSGGTVSTGRIRVEVGR